MKAHINGITVEGTPQEIMEYQRLQGEKQVHEWQRQMGTGYNPNQFIPKITCDSTSAQKNMDMYAWNGPIDHKWDGILRN